MVNCKHENTWALYARDEKTWISTKSLCGNMIYVCSDCRAITEKKTVIKRYLKYGGKKDE